MINFFVQLNYLDICSFSSRNFKLYLIHERNFKMILKLEKSFTIQKKMKRTYKTMLHYIVALVSEYLSGQHWETAKMHFWTEQKQWNKPKQIHFESYSILNFEWKYKMEVFMFFAGVCRHLKLLNFFNLNLKVVKIYRNPLGKHENFHSTTM